MRKMCHEKSERQKKKNNSKIRLWIICKSRNLEEKKLKVGKLQHLPLLLSYYKALDKVTPTVTLMAYG